MTLIEQEFVIKKCEEEYIDLCKKLHNYDSCKKHYNYDKFFPYYTYCSEEELEIDLNRREELKKMLPKLRAAFNTNLERAYEEIINDKK